MKKLLAGIDIGGTKIAVCIGTDRGKILARSVFSALGGRDLKKSLEQIKDSLSSLLSSLNKNKKDLLGVGVGVPGIIDPKSQVLIKSPNLPAWEGVALKRHLSKVLGLKVYVDNDANAAALGEQFFGEGKSVDDFVYLTISTGIGGGLVASGKLIRGAQGMAGEVGHMTMVTNGAVCACGKKGCLEAYGSGTAMANRVKRELKAGAKSEFFKNVKLNDITGQLVADAAKAGDSLAIRIREEAADVLGTALANLINLLNTERIILGGGVMQQTHHFWNPMMTAVKREAWPSTLRSCKIVKSKLGQHVGELGAIALVLEKER